MKGFIVFWIDIKDTIDEVKKKMMSRAKETNLIPFPRWSEQEFITKANQGNDVRNKQSAFQLCVGPANLNREIWILIPGEMGNRLDK